MSNLTRPVISHKSRDLICGCTRDGSLICGEHIKIKVSERELRIALVAAEHGHRECERGKNLLATLASVRAIYKI